MEKVPFQIQSPLLLFFAVTGMKWMNQYIPFFARSIVQQVAENEVIACGLMSKDNEPLLIYSPIMQQNEYVIRKTAAGGKRIATNEPVSYIGNIIVAVNLPDAKDGEVYHVIGNRIKDKKKVFSPAIHMKMKTEYSTEIEVQDNTIHWEEWAKHYTGMIYMISIATEEGDAIYSSYTRETTMSYPERQQESLHLEGQGRLESGKKYTATVCIVDYQGWVPAVAQTTFIYNRLKGGEENG